MMNDSGQWSLGRSGHWWMTLQVIVQWWMMMPCEGKDSPAECECALDPIESDFQCKRVCWRNMLTWWMTGEGPEICLWLWLKRPRLQWLWTSYFQYLPKEQTPHCLASGTDCLPTEAIWTSLYRASELCARSKNSNKRSEAGANCGVALVKLLVEDDGGDKQRFWHWWIPTLPIMRIVAFECFIVILLQSLAVIMQSQWIVLVIVGCNKRIQMITCFSFAVTNVVPRICNPFTWNVFLSIANPTEIMG